MLTPSREVPTIIYSTPEQCREWIASLDKIVESSRLLSLDIRTEIAAAEVRTLREDPLPTDLEKEAQALERQARRIRLAGQVDAAADDHTSQSTAERRPPATNAISDSLRIRGGRGDRNEIVAEVLKQNPNSNFTKESVEKSGRQMMYRGKLSIFPDDSSGPQEWTLVRMGEKKATPAPAVKVRRQRKPKFLSWFRAQVDTHEINLPCTRDELAEKWLAVSGKKISHSMIAMAFREDPKRSLSKGYFILAVDGRITLEIYEPAGEDE
jgi:hypothetical protein